MTGIFSEYRKMNQVTGKKYAVIFYAENAYYFQYFRHLYESLKTVNISICYITSDSKDPVLQESSHNVDVIYSKTMLAYLFGKLKADVMVMTMPDLGNFIFKRSASVKKYVYVFHALVSTHQQYLAGAFDHYDAVFCAGPHHEAELREGEKIYGSKKKELIRYGYPLLNDLATRTEKNPESTGELLIAPSWYDKGIFQTCIHPLIDMLSTTPYRVKLRPHPEYIKRNRKSFKEFIKKTETHSNLSLDLDPVLWNSMIKAQHLITDRSGIAFEFAFTKYVPVIFIDTPLKLRNSEAGRYQNPPVENKFRKSIGLSTSVDALQEIPLLLEKAEKETEEYKTRIAEIKKEVVFDPSFLQQGVQYILDQIS